MDQPARSGFSHPGCSSFPTGSITYSIFGCNCDRRCAGTWMAHSQHKVLPLYKSQSHHSSCPIFASLTSHGSGIARRWWKAQPFDLCHRDPMAIGIVLSVFGLGFFCWLFFTLAVYALPFLAGLKAPILRRELDA